MRKITANIGYSVNWTDAESGVDRRVILLPKTRAVALAADLRGNPEVDDVHILGPDGNEVKP